MTKFRLLHDRVRESDYERIAARLETSARTLYRWEVADKKMGAQGLISKKSTEKKANFIRGHTAQKIQEMRKLYNWGAEVIQAQWNGVYQQLPLPPECAQASCLRPILERVSQKN